MNLLKETMINRVEEKSLMSISSKSYSMGKEAMEHFIYSLLVFPEKSIYDPIKKLKLGTFSNMTKKVTVKLRGKDVQFSL